MTTASTKAMQTDTSDPTVHVTTHGYSSRSLWEALTYFGAGEMAEFSEKVQAGRTKEQEEAYLLAIGLARLKGEQAGFEDIAVDYATSFGKSPPEWLPAHSKSTSDRSSQSMTIAIERITTDTIVESMISMETPVMLVVDFADCRKVDPEGVELFNDALRNRFDQNSGRTRLINGDALIQYILNQIASMPAQTNAAVWKFIFTYFQTNGARDRFGEAARACAANGGDAPSWIDLSVPLAEDLYEENRLGILMPESLSSYNVALAEECLSSVEAKAALHSKTPVPLDLARTASASLADALNLRAFLDVFFKRGLQLTLLNTNEILIQMFKVMGVDQVVKRIIAPGHTA